MECLRAHGVASEDTEKLNVPVIVVSLKDDDGTVEKFPAEMAQSSLATMVPIQMSQWETDQR
jgi:hypothetical protein